MEVFLNTIVLFNDQINWNFLDANYQNKNMHKTSLQHIRLELDLQDTNEGIKNIKNL